MCGIFYLKNHEKKQHREFISDVKDLWLASTRRGSDSCGIYILFTKKNSTQKDVIFRVSSSPENILNSHRFKNLLHNFNENGFIIEFIIGHTRMNTDGSSYNKKNNQPLAYDDSLLVFNGIITNTEDFNHPINTNDGYILLDNFDKNYSPEKFNNFLTNNTSGIINLIMIKRSLGQLYFYSNNGSLFSDDVKNPTIICSEPTFVPNLSLKRIPLHKLIAIKNHIKLPQKLQIIDLKYNKSPVIVADVNYSKKFIKVEKKINDIDDYWVNRIVRCKKCVLPSTHPFINFDSNGVCNFCRSHKSIKLKNKSIFRNKLINTNPNKIMLGLSGGRDSSYALHLLAKDYDIKPITYTYDWGVNTNLSRRNVSRMCGELGVENILIAADIRKKRKNVKMNLLAWLKNPHPGLLPLLMAGDKQFISNAKLIKEEREIEKEIFAFNLHEKTQFKEDFTGVKMWNDTDNDSYGEDLGITKQLQMIFFYVKQGIVNPRLINTSLIDTAKGFLNYYHSKVSIIQLFEYNDWDEDSMNNSLRSGYDWEFANDTTTSWRIGDGTAAFYNLAYFLMAGFTENDVIRSNLIREKKLTRGKALSLISSENIPRYATLKWYLDILNLNFNATMNSLIDNTQKYRKI
jgi:glutamine---fructose-6-phosphate transaminase (isomerizing)